MGKSPPSSANPLATQSAKPTRRFRYFLVLWIVFVVGGWCWVQVGNSDDDVKFLANLICGGLVFAAVTAWLTFFSGFKRATRILLGIGPWVVLGLFLSQLEVVNDGNMRIVGFRFRWAPRPDQLLEVPDAPHDAIDDWGTTDHDYPGFLGTHYWAEVPGIHLATDWETNPPQERWRCPVGAGWSGFAIVGDFAVTQEQRGEQELVVCYRLSSDNSQGEIVWLHADEVRFAPTGPGKLGYVGPRATPTVYDGRVLSMGATGMLNCLDAKNGKAVWAHDTLTEHDIENIMWGKASSPVILEIADQPPLVIVSVGAPGASLVAFDLETGYEVWAAGSHRSSYATPVVCELAGQQQIISVNEEYVTAHAAEDGHILWEFPWPGNSDSDATCSQPVPVSKNRVFLSKGYSIGACLLEITRTAEGEFTATPVWDPPVNHRVMKTKMGNIVLRDGYVYGLDGGILECIELATGKKMWKKRRLPAIGHGQIMAVGDQLVVSTETGELVLIALDPQKYRELASMRVFPEDEITWNNPAFSAPYLLLRNARQAVCLEMPLVEARENPATLAADHSSQGD